MSRLKFFNKFWFFILFTSNTKQGLRQTPKLSKHYKISFFFSKIINNFISSSNIFSTKKYINFAPKFLMIFTKKRSFLSIIFKTPQNIIYFASISNKLSNFLIKLNKKLNSLTIINFSSKNSPTSPKCSKNKNKFAYSFMPGELNTKIAKFSSITLIHSFLLSQINLKHYVFLVFKSRKFSLSSIKSPSFSIKSISPKRFTTIFKTSKLIQKFNHCLSKKRKIKSFAKNNQY